jgi:hypothetical protein
VREQVSHPYKTTGQIIVLYTLIFVFLDSNLEDKRFCTDSPSLLFKNYWPQHFKRFQFAVFKGYPACDHTVIRNTSGRTYSQQCLCRSSTLRYV